MTKKQVQADRARYLQTYCGRALMKEHELGEVGVWKVLGEQYGGARTKPLLGYFKGTLNEVIELAVTLPRFTSWGAGGDITLYKAPHIHDAKTYTEQLGRIVELKEERNKIDLQLIMLGEK